MQLSYENSCTAPVLQVPKYLKSDIALDDVNIMSQSPDSDPAIANVMFVKSNQIFQNYFRCHRMATVPQAWFGQIEQHYWPVILDTKDNDQIWLDWFVY